MLSSQRTQEPHIQLRSLVRIIRCDVCFSQLIRFLCELSPYAAMYELNWASEFLARRRACSTHIRVARVSRFDRHLRYYSEDRKLASVLSMYSTCGICRRSLPKNRHNAQNAAPNGAAFRSCFATGLPNVAAGGYPPHLLQDIRPVYPVWGRSVGGGSCRACCSWLADMRQPVHHWRPSNSNRWAVHLSIYNQ